MGSLIIIFNIHILNNACNFYFYSTFWNFDAKNIYVLWCHECHILNWYKISKASFHKKTILTFLDIEVPTHTNKHTTKDLWTSLYCQSRFDSLRKQWRPWRTRNQHRGSDWWVSALPHCCVVKYSTKLWHYLNLLSNTLSLATSWGCIHASYPTSMLLMLRPMGFKEVR